MGFRRLAASAQGCVSFKTVPKGYAEPLSASLAQPLELSLQDGEAIEKVEDHPDTLQVHTEVSAQA